MFSLQNLLQKKDKLLCLLEASAVEGHRSVQALMLACNHLEDDKATQDLAYGRVADRNITEEIRKELYETFITALDREDLELLAAALYKIPKAADKFIERLQTTPELARKVDFSVQLSYAQRGTEVLASMVKSLQRGLEPERIQESNEQLQQIEGDADKHILKLYKVLYNGRYAFEEAIVLKDLFELLEKLVDRTRDAGNIIARIALKNS